MGAGRVEKKLFKAPIEQKKKTKKLTSRSNKAKSLKKGLE